MLEYLYFRYLFASIIFYILGLKGFFQWVSNENIRVKIL